MDYAALLQTILWVGLIVWIVRKFSTQIFGLLSAVQRRIEEGSGVKVAGMLEVAPAIQQQQKISQELDGPDVPAMPLEPVNENQPARPISDRSKGLRQRRLIQAEDLALRAIQADVGQPILRQMTFSNGPRRIVFDGAFEAGGMLNVVEVFYLPAQGKLPNYKASLVGIESELRDRKSPEKIRLIVALVFEQNLDPTVLSEVLTFTKGLAIDLDFRVFTLLELHARFGVVDDLALSP